MAKKIKDHYRDKDAQDHQEVVTPPELVDHIYNFLSKEDFHGKDILDPCVGPGALIEPILKDLENGGNDLGLKSLTVMDIQPLHIDNFKKRLLEIKAKKEDDEY